jgi:hypothetical protein
MSYIVNDTLILYLPSKRKQTPSGWLAFNAPCCAHNGESQDKKARGGLINESETVSYHCFNCGFKASWQPGRNLSVKMKKLLQWLGAPDDVINKLALDVMRENEGIETQHRKIELPTFSTVRLPDDAVNIAEVVNSERIDKHLYKVLKYMSSRNLNLDDTDYYWIPSSGYRDRLVIPFYYEGRTVGWTARSIIPDKKPKYLTEIQPGFVYGIDKQTRDREFVIVCEGQIDAIHIEGCALGGSEISEQQAMLLTGLGRDIVVVPDRDTAGSRLVEHAIARGWAVSFPNWPSSINDISDAVKQYGRLYTLYSIVKAANFSTLKIRLGAKKWFI